MTIEFEYLADRPESIPQVVDWWFAVWADYMDASRDKIAEHLVASLSKDKLPLYILAIKHGEPVGTAALKLHELEELFPDKQYWLGSVFVDSKHRGNNIGTELSQRVIEIAKLRSIPQLYLQTLSPHGGLYTKLGWKPVERFSNKGVDTVLMLKSLA